MKRFAISVGLFALVVCSAVAIPFSSAVSAPPPRIPVIVQFHKDASFAQSRGFYRADDRALANAAAWDYLDPGVAGRVQALEASHGFRATHVFSHAVRGFAAHLTARQIEALDSDPDVALIEPDDVVFANAQTVPWGITQIQADLSSTQAGNGSGAITNVRVYVIDTGIDTAHPDLSVVQHVNFAGGKNIDCNGHGTHVAGTIAAKDNTSYVVGVAPGAPLTGVKVLGCSGSGYMSGVIKGVDWVTANAVRPAVANMSLGGGASVTLDAALQRSALAGIFYAVAAGNDGDDACLGSPARAAAGTTGIMAVGATDKANLDPSWSNWGACVDVWAPGVSILSTRKGGGTTTMSGTSMASPHVAGTAAVYLSRNPSTDAETVEMVLKSHATPTGTSANDGGAISLVNVSAY